MKAEYDPREFYAAAGLSTRAINVLRRLGWPSKEAVYQCHSNKLVERGAGQKTIREICEWAGRDYPATQYGLAPSERMSDEETRERLYCEKLRKAGYTVNPPKDGNPRRWLYADTSLEELDRNTNND